MTSLFYDVQRTVEKTAARSMLPISGILKILGISRAWYYRQLDPSPIIDKRFNPFEVRDEELRVLQYRYNHPKMSFRLLAYSMIDHDIAYLSPSEVYKILKKFDLITPWKRPIWESSKPERAKSPDERWQVDIMYVKIKDRFFYLIIFIDEYSRYITHHSLMTSMDSDSVSIEAQKAIENLRRDSLAIPIIQSDNGSAFISLDFKIVLNNNGLTHKKIHPHTPKQNGIVERANKTMREELSPLIITDYQNAQNEISRIIHWYNYERMHSSLNYLTPSQYYRGNPGDLLNIREGKLEMARIMRKETNMNKRKGGEMAGSHTLI
ncbi:MAG: integrase core domain-containing protein [Thermoplasmatales archaeon]|jgi:transposase InsO family protein|nr:integrase core domain-containing protein [Candidatus Thermoplasmatota archaeon]MDA8054503.1 integrase core domain-containing protein [Thermoplasmatales archaeon]